MAGRTAAVIEVSLHPMSLATAAGLLTGRRVVDACRGATLRVDVCRGATLRVDVCRGATLRVDGPPWHPAYPLADTLIGVSLLVDAHKAVGWDSRGAPDWWIHQVISDGVVVGDIGFHGPPDSAGVVEVGYALVEAVRGRGIATAACRQILAVAWRDGATAVLAEAAVDNLASRRVLAKSGFVLRDDGVFEARP